MKRKYRGVDCVHLCKLNKDHKRNSNVKMQVNACSILELSTPNKSTYIIAHMSHFMITPVSGVLQSITIQTCKLSYRDQLKS